MCQFVGNAIGDTLFVAFAYYTGTCILHVRLCLSGALTQCMYNVHTSVHCIYMHSHPKYMYASIHVLTNAHKHVLVSHHHNNIVTHLLTNVFLL